MYFDQLLGPCWSKYFFIPISKLIPLQNAKLITESSGSEYYMYFILIHYYSRRILGCGITYHWVWSIGPKPEGRKMKNEKAETLKMGVFRANLT